MMSTYQLEPRSKPKHISKFSIKEYLIITQTEHKTLTKMISASISIQMISNNLHEPGGRLRLGLSWFNWWVSSAPEFQCCYFCESACLFYLSFNSDFYVSKIMHL